MALCTTATGDKYVIGAISSDLSEDVENNINYKQSRKLFVGLWQTEIVTEKGSSIPIAYLAPRAHIINQQGAFCHSPRTTTRTKTYIINLPGLDFVLLRLPLLKRNPSGSFLPLKCLFCGSIQSWASSTKH